jgi:CHAD domain-containing protein
MKLAPISRYARRETLGRQKRLIAASRRAAKNPQDAEAIHGLRVSIRRFTQCLRIFDQLLDPAAPKQLRKRLRKLMDRCAAARNCDVALDLLGQVGLVAGPSVPKLQKARTKAERDLHRRLKTEHRRRIPSLEASRQPPDGDWKLAQSVEDNLRRVLPSLARDFFEAGSAAAVPGASPQASAARRRSRDCRTASEPLTIASLPSIFWDATVAP